jgi:response regulator of citrate/malate metabolism
MTLPILSCGVIEFEPPAAALMDFFIRRTEGLALAWTCGSQEDVHVFLEKQNPDILFWEVRAVPIVVAPILVPIVKYHSNIIITSAMFEEMLEKVPFQYVDWLHKPFSYSRFLEGIEKVRNAKSGSSD